MKNLKKNLLLLAIIFPVIILLSSVFAEKSLAANIGGFQIEPSACPASSIALSWNAYPNAKYYWVKRDNTTVSECNNITKTQCTDLTIQRRNIGYQYTVYAYLEGASAPSSSIKVDYSPCPTPKPPTPTPTPDGIKVTIISATPTPSPTITPTPTPTPIPTEKFEFYKKAIPLAKTLIQLQQYLNDMNDNVSVTQELTISQYSTLYYNYYMPKYNELMSAQSTPSSAPTTASAAKLVWRQIAACIAPTATPTSTPPPSTSATNSPSRQKATGLGNYCDFSGNNNCSIGQRCEVPADCEVNDIEQCTTGVCVLVVPTAAPTATLTPTTFKIKEQLNPCLSFLDTVMVLRDIENVPAEDKWVFFSPEAPDRVNDLIEIFPGEEVRIKMTDNCTLTYNNHTYNLVSGDNTFVWEPASTPTPTAASSPTPTPTVTQTQNLFSVGDANRDGHITETDLILVANEISKEQPNLSYDLNADRKVNVIDYNIVLYAIKNKVSP